MNHYPHHIGDYDSDTAHLEWVEDLAYTRLLRLYYRTERPISADLNEACRLVRAKAKDERRAVETVLKEFFTLQEDGWHNKRADIEIAAFVDGSEERQQRLAHETERMRRHRERRKEMFATLRERGIVPKWDTKTEELQRLCNASINAPETRTGDGQNADATANQNQNQNHINTPTPCSGEFERFWSAWPKSERKQGKSKCYEVWKKKKLDSIAEQILSHVEAMKGSEGWRGGYDPMPLTYLNRGAWDGAELPANSSKPAHHASWT